MYCTLICLKMSRMSPTAVIPISRMVSLLISSSTSSAMLKKKFKKKTSDQLLKNLDLQKVQNSPFPFKNNFNSLSLARNKSF